MLKLFNKYAPQIKFGLLSVMFVMISVQNSYAEVDFGELETFMQGIVNVLSGPLAIAFAALSIMGVGALFMTGNMDWKFALAVVFGIAIMFGAVSFVDGLTQTELTGGGGA
ncbi:MAG: TrbC/VirB2 family protein [Pseudomonadota bacterium]